MRSETTADAGSVSTSTRLDRHGLLDAALIATAALVLRLPGVLATRHHHPDDGTYGVSAIAMRDGGVPFRDVFSSQGPLHLPLVRLFDLGHTHWSPRVSSLLAGIGVAVVAYLIGRRITTRRGAVLSGLIVATSGSMLWTTGPITSDGTTAFFVTLTFLLALVVWERPSIAGSIALGAAAGAAMLLKPALGILGVLPAAWLLYRARRRAALLVGAASALALGLATTLPFGLANVWDQAIRYQLDSERTQSVGANAIKIATTLWDRELLLLTTVLLAGIATAIGRRGLRTETSSTRAIDGALALWAGLVVAFLVLQPALWRNHVTALVVPVTLLAARRCVVGWWVIAGLVVVAPLHVAHTRDILDPPPYAGPTAEAAAALGALPDGAMVLSDEVGIVWRSGLRTPDDFVDASIKQLEQGRITTERIAATASADPVCAVLVWRASHWGSLDDLPAALVEVGYSPAQRFAGQDGARVLYLRATCDPS